MLLCTVRDCRQPLVRQDRSWRCATGHTFDVARSGYVNLLQPQDRRSKSPGDTVEAVQGRRRLHDSGATAPLLEAIQAIVKPSVDDTILDAGCGEGFYLGSLGDADRHGVDISIPAIDAAAKRYPGCRWVVANADRMLPYADASFTAVLSLTARMNPAEFHRVLKPGGRLLIALAGAGDLIELRGEGRDDRIDRTIADFRDFPLQARQSVTTKASLDAETLAGVLHAIYRPLTSPPAAGMEVTLSLDLLLFERL